MSLFETDRPLRSARKAKGDGHLRRAEILEAAERIFVEQGYDGATIRRIADEVGVSSTALYMHFRDKGEMLVEICAGQFEWLIGVNTALLEQELDCVLRVRRMLEAYVDFAWEHPNAYRLCFVERAHAAPETPDERLIELGRRTFDLFRQGVGRIEAGGRLRIETELAAQTFWAACHGMVALVLTHPTFAWCERRDLRQAMLDTLIAGLTRA